MYGHRLGVRARISSGHGGGIAIDTQATGGGKIGNLVDRRLFQHRR